MSSVVIAGDTSGSITLNAPAVAGTTTLTLPTTSATLLTDSSGVLNIGSGQLYKDSSGNVGIGTTSPTQALTVNGRLAFSNLFAASNIDGIFLQSGVGTTVNTATGNNITFNTGTTERMRINSSGNVGIGTTTQDTRLVVSANTGTAVQRIYNTNATNTYQMSFHNSTQECGTITTGNNTVGYNSNSDYRLKENVVPMTGALDKVAQLNPVTYTWKASGTAGQGFIAHELQEHFPEAVSGEKDAVDADGKPIYQGMDTSFLVATLTAAIQELKAKLDTVKTELAILKGAA